MGGFGGDREASGKRGCIASLPFQCLSPGAACLNCAQQHPLFPAAGGRPPDPAILNRLFDHMQSGELILFSIDYPHWYDRLKIVAMETTP